MTSRLGQLAERAAREAIPLDVAIELVARCNFSCVHCYVLDRTGPEPRDAVPTVRLLELLDELVELGTLRLALTGGEPLLRRDWELVLTRGRELGFAVRLLTNASLVSDETARIVAGLGATVDVSLYTVDADVFEGITRVPGSLRRTLEGIERLLAHGVEVRLKVPLLRPAFDGLEDVFSYAKRVGAACLPSPLVTPRRDGDSAPLDLRLARAELERFLGSARFSYAEPDPLAWRQGSDEPLCGAGARTAVVTATGDVLACHDLATPAGNILELPFATIWRESPWLARLRSLRRNDLPNCGGCGRLRYCNRCQAQALNEGGDLLGPSRSACDYAETLERLGLARDPR